MHALHVLTAIAPGVASLGACWACEQTGRANQGQGSSPGIKPPAHKAKAKPVEMPHVLNDPQTYYLCVRPPWERWPHVEQLPYLSRGHRALQP